MAHKARYYQSEARQASSDALKRSVKTQMIVGATGTGKSKIGVDIAQDYRNVLWLNHNIELIEQNAITFLAEQFDFSKEYVENGFNIRGGLVSLLKAKRDTEDAFATLVQDNIGIIKEDLLITNKRVTIASVQTIWRRLNQLPPDLFDLVIVDECHHAGAVTWTMILNHFNPILRLGLTATPWRAIDDLTLDDLFEEIVYEYPIVKAIKDGNLCKPTGIKVKTSTSLDKVHNQGADFNQKELAEKVNSPERNYLVVNSYIKHALGRPFIVFCVNVEHVTDLCAAFNEKGVKANYVVGDTDLTPERKNIINDFKNQNFIDNEAEGLVNCLIATEGFDYLDAGCIILAAPTKSKTRFYQTVGRGLRLKTEKYVEKFGQGCIILDVVDNTTKHRVITCESEDALLPVEDRIFISDENRAKLMDAKAKREAMVNLVERKEDEVFELFPLPKIPRFKRCNDPASEAQLQRIKKLGYNIEENTFSVMQVNDIFMNQPAPKQQIDFLSEAGYDISRGVTVIEAQLAITELSKRKK
ncbi:MAG: DEAD/DEAH box helicase [Bacteroidota bacterium]